MSLTINLDNGKVAERKLLITVAEWNTTVGTTVTQHREILGTRTEDSSIEFNADIETMTDIRGITYTDVNKTEPQQSFDPFYIMGGSDLAAYLTEAALKNDITAYNNCFNIYIIAAYSGDSTNGYYTVEHKNSSIIPTSMGGDAKVSLPIEVHFSNDIVVGKVDALTDSFVFTPAS